LKITLTTIQKKSDNLEVLVLSSMIFELGLQRFSWAPIIIIFDLQWSSGYKLVLGIHLVYKVKTIKFFFGLIKTKSQIIFPKQCTCGGNG
jgi:hypothetical protein